MVEYLYNAIKADSNAPIIITAVIKDEEELPITSGCILKLYDDQKLLQTVNGVYSNSNWYFTIPAVNEKGRFWYQISYSGGSLNFKQPIYLI